MTIFCYHLVKILPKLFELFLLNKLNLRKIDNIKF